MLGRTLEQKAQWIYRIASVVATVEAFFLFILGLDLSFDQVKLFFLFGFPAPIVMYLFDRWLIGRHVKPIQTVLEALDTGRSTDPQVVSQAWVQALNLPTLTLLRVLTVHAPSVLLPLTLLCLLANQVAGLGLRWWQFVVLWLFWPITAAPHAIVEYFLIDRVIRPILARLDPHVRNQGPMSPQAATPWEILRMTVGEALPESRIIRTATGVQLAWLFIFVSLMPMFVLGTSAYLKTVVTSTAASGKYLQEIARIVASTPAGVPVEDGYLFRFDPQGEAVGDTPPPELSFAVLNPLAKGPAGWLETGGFLVGYARESDGGLVIRALPVKVAAPTGSLGRWIIFLVAINMGVSVAIIALLSIRVHRSMRELLSQMRRVQEGDLFGEWSPRSTDEFLDLGNGFNQMLAGLRDREAIKDTFGRFVSRDVAEAVLSGRIPLTGDRREVSILFQDMRGFTSMAEKMDPDLLVQVLNQFFTEMVAAVEAEGGVVKQFVGDGVMALFGAPVAYPDHAVRAVRAALGMGARLEGLNARLKAQGRPPIQIGVGIHTGEVVAGKIGPDKRVEYAVVGDPVNLASRMEGLTKEMQATILISEVTAARLKPGFRLGRTAVLPVKGKAKPVGVVEVLGYEPGLAP